MPSPPAPTCSPPSPSTPPPLPAGQNGIKFTPKGLAIGPLGGWGNLRHACNAAMLNVIWAKHTPDPAARAAALKFAQQQVDYALGSRWAAALGGAWWVGGAG